MRHQFTALGEPEPNFNNIAFEVPVQKVSSGHGSNFQLSHHASALTVNSTSESNMELAESTTLDDPQDANISYLIPSSFSGMVVFIKTSSSASNFTGLTSFYRPHIRFTRGIRRPRENPFIPVSSYWRITHKQ